jgi:hypothetical protein
MTTNPDLLELARELERAARGSRGLDIKIALAAEPYPRRVRLWISLELGAPANCDFTRSIDAALTLLPPAMPWQADTLDGPHAHVGTFEARARTVPLAIAAAALRARVAAASESAAGATDSGA